MKRNNIKAFVTIGMLSGLAYVLMLLNFPLPGFPTWLKIDLSDIPALVAAIIMGPGAAIIVEVLKNLLDLITTGTETGVPVGHIANFVTALSFILPTYYVYSKVKSKKGMTIALATATVITTLVMSFLNLWIFLPMYKYFMNFPLPNEVVWTIILPFNLIKGTMLSIVFMLLFVKMYDWMQKQQKAFK